MKIQAVFFDIDGTLCSLKNGQVPQSTRQALEALHRNGVYTFVATGRSPTQLTETMEQLGGGFTGALTMNGQYCQVQGRTVRDEWLPRQALEKVLPYLEQTGLLCHFAELDCAYLNRPANVWHGISMDPARALTHRVYQISPFVTVEQEAALAPWLPGCRMVRWHPDFVDVIPEKGGKAVGMAAVLAALGLSPEQCAAIGDGGNDIEMLRAAGVGVAMGNAAPQVQAAADFVTRPQEEDGLAWALEQLGLV